jgi:hypothetical protein
MQQQYQKEQYNKYLCTGNSDQIVSFTGTYRHSKTDE